jgi:hypothetical protein
MQANFPALMDMARRAEGDRMYYLAADYYRSALEFECKDKTRAWVRERVKFCTLTGLRFDAISDGDDEREGSPVFMMYRDITARIMANEDLSMMQRHDMCLHLLELEMERVQESRREHINKNNLNKDDKKATI